MTRVILIPLDGSEAAEEIIPHVEVLASSLRADILLLRVIPELQCSLETCYYPSLEMAREDAEREWMKHKVAAERYLSALTAAIRAKNIYASWKVVAGRPTDAIVEVALLRGASLVAMCTHARSGIDRIIHGSVAAEVMKRLDGIPVLLTRATQSAGALQSLPLGRGR